MGGIENIGAYLSAHQATATREHMERSLIETFRTMFNLNLETTNAARLDRANSTAAYVMLYHERASACVCVRLLKTTALLIAKSAGIEVTPAIKESVIEDVSCEIVNIVGNHLRTFLSETVGVYFDMGKLTTNEADIAALNPSIVLNLDFRADPEALIHLDFKCGDGAGSKIEVPSQQSGLI